MSHSTRTVLCIDDDEDDRQFICEAINLADPTISVLHAESGMKGIIMLKEMKDNKEVPCLIILDVNMPVMDGRETLVAIRKLDLQVPVVLFTTGISATTKELNELVTQYHAELQGKPNNMKEIVAAVQKMLGYCSRK
jgi:CheY-like chemotaxis protein